MHRQHLGFLRVIAFEIEKILIHEPEAFGDFELSTFNRTLDLTCPDNNVNRVQRFLDHEHIDYVTKDYGHNRTQFQIDMGAVNEFH